jgi:hypothetical protein
MKEIEKPTFVQAKNQTPKTQNDIVIGEIQGLKKRDIMKFFLKNTHRETEHSDCYSETTIIRHYPSTKTKSYFLLFKLF